MGVLLPMDDDDVDPHDKPTLPGVVIVPESAFTDEADTDPLLEDPSSWDSDDEDTKRFRVLQ